MKRIYFLLLLFPVLVNAQDNSQGIQFVSGLTWKQIKEKAKEENKYIFVDGYATWCKPCKEMEIKVYPNDTLGEFANKRFISVKIQMDSTKRDDQNVKMLYPAAREIEKKYQIVALPTFLFFSPDGEAVHKEMGYKNVNQFLDLLKDVTNADSQIYTQIKRWQAGSLPYNELPALANRLKKGKEDSLSIEVAKSYIRKYLYKLKEEELLAKQNLTFLGQYTQAVNVGDRMYKLYYAKSDKVDSIMKEPGYSKKRVNYIISKDEIYPSIAESFRKGKDPDWIGIEKQVKAKYPAEFVSNNVIEAKMKWYRTKKDGENYYKAIMEYWRLHKDGFSNMSWMALNEYAWVVGGYSHSKEDRLLAIKWVEWGLAGQTNIHIVMGMLDTKANILYKAGRKNEAIAIMEEVLHKHGKIMYDQESDKNYAQKVLDMHQKTLTKMRNGYVIDMSSF